MLSRGESQPKVTQLAMTKGRRRLRFATLRDVPPDVDRLVAQGHRTVGRWTLAQICNHLSSNIVHTIDGFPGPVAPWIVRQTLGRAVRGLMLTPGRIMEGAPIPKNYRPAPTLDATAEVTALRAAIERFCSSQIECKPHPFLGWMSYKEWERFHCIHCGHHLSFVLAGNL